MAILKKMRALFHKKKVEEKKVEYVEEGVFASSDEQSMPLSKERLGEVDFSYRGDLEAYVRGLAVPRELVERWISAGLLFPEEMIMAEKIAKIMIKMEHEQIH